MNLSMGFWGSLLDKHVIEYEYMLEISIIYFPYLAVHDCLFRNAEAKQRVIGDILLPILNVLTLCLGRISNRFGGARLNSNEPSPKS